jgi:hypothetical protein
MRAVEVRAKSPPAGGPRILACGELFARGTIDA